MRNRFIAFFMCLVLCSHCIAQTDTTNVVIDSVTVDEVVTDTATIEITDNIITNSSSLKLFFEKLYLLEQQKQGKVNIVHIGDSHIQADLFTGIIRKNLQSRFGNAGCGFTFPHSLANTNGSHYVRFKSNVGWQSRRNIYEPNGMKVGLSGIALATNDNFAVELNVRDTSYAFNTIKIITPGNRPLFDLATSTKNIVLESNVPKQIIHKIKNGEVLGSIASKYGVSVAQIKKLNGLKNDRIRAGKTLKINTGQTEQKEVRRSEFIPLPLQSDENSNYFYNPQPLSKIYLLPGKSEGKFDLNGLVLEKDAPGVLYHNIGVNGAKASDYNKYPLFFEQLPALKPDLIIVSLGTNESFDKMPVSAYMEQMNMFLQNIKAKNPDAAILVMTPPPSLFSRKYPNTFVADYAKHLTMQETEKNYGSWDLFSTMGGLYSVNRNAARGLISSDKVHYSKAGYEKQGVLFTEALLNAYESFKLTRN